MRVIWLSETGALRPIVGRGDTDPVRSLVRLLPATMPLGMAAVFAVAGASLGRRRGYIAGFATYWTLCLAVPLLLLGRRRFVELFTRGPQPFPSPRMLAAAALMLPAAGAIGVELIPNLRTASAKLLATSIGIATVNAVSEEVFWRGVPITEFPDDRWSGWLVPATGFTLWHLVPLAARRRWSRVPGVLAGAALIGYGYGWVAWRTRSVRWTLPLHVLTDASGLRAVRRVWLGDEGA